MTVVSFGLCVAPDQYLQIDKSEAGPDEAWPASAKPVTVHCNLYRRHHARSFHQETTMNKLSTTLLLFTVLLVLLPTETYAFGAGEIPDFAYLHGTLIRV